MDLERREAEQPPGLPFPAKVALGALALWGGFTVIQWALFSALRYIRFGLFVVIVVALFGWVISAKGSR